MTVLPMHQPSPTTLLAVGPIRVQLTDAPADIVEAQGLRYRVFASEPGFADGIGDDDTCRESDRFDVFSEHLIVRHDVAGVIGCARLLAPPRAIAAGGWYSATEFDLAGLDQIASATVEMGRVCIDDEFRGGTVAALMWAAVTDYMQRTGYRYLMGCVSVPLIPEGTDGDGGATLRAVRDRLLTDYRGSLSVAPHRDPRVDGRPLADIAPAAGAALPPLMRAYLRLGAKVCGEPAVDDDFGVGDFLTILDREDCNSRYFDRLRSTALRLGGSR